MKITKKLRVFEVRYTGASNAPVELHLGTSEESYIYLTKELAAQLKISPASINQNLVLELNTIVHDWFTGESTRQDLLSINDLQKTEKTFAFQTTEGDVQRTDVYYSVQVQTPTFGTICILPIPYLKLALTLTEEEYNELKKELKRDTKFTYQLLALEPAGEAS